MNPLRYRVFDRTKHPMPPPTDMRSWVIQADPDWSKNSVQPVIYEFSNDRAFSTTEQPGAKYGWV